MLAYLGDPLYTDITSATASSLNSLVTANSGKYSTYPKIKLVAS